MKYIIDHNGKGLIGDEMGLGKTIQAIAVCTLCFEYFAMFAIIYVCNRLQPTIVKIGQFW